MYIYIEREQSVKGDDNTSRLHDTVKQNGETNRGGLVRPRRDSCNRLVNPSRSTVSFKRSTIQ